MEFIAAEFVSLKALLNPLKSLVVRNLGASIALGVEVAAGAVAAETCARTEVDVRQKEKNREAVTASRYDRAKRRMAIVYRST